MSFEEDYFNIGSWLHKKLGYHKISNHRVEKNKQVILGEIWQCDLGYNIGEEKNKVRPAMVISNNSINRTGKAVVICITDAQNKVNRFNLPPQNSWYLLYSDTADVTKMFAPGRVIPSGATRYTFLDKDSVLQCEEIRSVSKTRLLSRVGNINPTDLVRIKEKMKKVFDIL
jgi:mRNA interferase MazF